MAKETFSLAERPVVALFSSAGGLGVSLVESLLANFCLVKIFSDNSPAWRENFPHLFLNHFVNLSPLPNRNDEIFADYFIFDNSFLRMDEGVAKVAVDVATKTGAKGLAILPYVYKSTDEYQIKEISKNFADAGPNFATIYVGDIVGARVGAGESYLVEKISHALHRNLFNLPPGGELFYPVSASDMAKQIVQSLFSFGPLGDKLAIIGQSETGADFAGRLKNFLPGLNLAYLKDGGERKEVACENKVFIRPRSDEAIGQTINWLRVKTPSQPRTKTKPERQKRPNWRPWAIFAALLVFVSPFILGTLSGLLVYWAAGAFKKGEISSSRLELSGALALAGVSEKFFQVMTTPPVVGRAFVLPLRMVKILERSSRVGMKAVEVAENSQEILAQIFSDKVYDPAAVSQRIYLGLESLYQEAGFLQTELASIGGEGNRLVAQRIGLDIPTLREKILLAKSLAGELPEILGKDGPKSYLVLFQNNMELRPTGGFIGSFALVNFDSGRLIDTSVMDVYAADGQLKGHVEPPLPVKNYLGEANWFLRDSNWDPDFPTSASRAEWFLDKEIDKSVDGVVGVDLNTAKMLLGVFGPVYLADFGQEINSHNLYEKTQAEVEANFFPGSQRKANFLTALARELLAKIAKVDKRYYLSLANGILGSLEQKHIQIFLHNKTAQKVLSRFGFDGAVALPTCRGNCYADFLGVVDANLGVNKANYFIRRSFALAVSLDTNTVSHTLRVIYENTANPALGPNGRYKTFTRVLVPPNSRTARAVISSAGETFEPEISREEIQGRGEIGIVVEVAPGQTKVATIIWESPTRLDLGQEGEYRLFWRKEAGTDADPLNIKIAVPSGISLASNDNYSLTKDGAYVYNSELARDFFSRLYFTLK